MMKKTILIAVLLSFYMGISQSSTHVSMIDYVQVLNKNKAEALFYYQNNWEQLRIQAIEKGYIVSYQLLETKPTPETPYTFMLITTYKNKAQYEASEKNFRKLIDAGDGLKLLNEKKPNDFRKIIIHQDNVKHWD
ncbi:hypothetical protein [Hwangdonia lutea]|uniref:NIPSNAP domain-containing protein n=1 Tax=Hwangdonia lutea TaxID=3075823 RepID=A0AA97EJC8_9FLAO|nr:hypothetical protein [Hwangdonia sp. SCSIO 19198]WOD42519.1 hypothetical protein RNZ46_10995 [Hwangdonia sp. SCSIO 19198]